MTYKESYMKCNTPEELKKEVQSDMAIAIMINTDRIEIINEAVEEVCKEKGWKCEINEKG